MAFANSRFCRNAGLEERVEREELAEKVKFYEKEFNVNPLSWGKRKKK